MHILITGGLGFIGSALGRELLARGHDVTAVDTLSPQIHGDLPGCVVPPGIRFIRGDIRDREVYAEALDNVDAVYHLAAETGTGQSMYQISRYVSCNELGTADLLEAIAAAKARPRKIFLASSRSVYGEGAYRQAGGGDDIISGRPRTKAMLDNQQWEPRGAEGQELEAVATPESLRYSPGSVYAATKAAQELLLQSAAEGVNAKAAIFRFQNVYGEGQSLQNPYTGIISIFFNRARQGFDIPLFEDGKPTRDFIHVEDIVRPLADALDADLAHGEIMNLGSGIATSVSDLAEALLQASGFDVPIKVTGQFRLGDIRHNWADIGRARELLGFSPQVDLISGLGRFVEWAKSQPEFEDRSEKANAELRAKGLTN